MLLPSRSPPSTLFPSCVKCFSSIYFSHLLLLHLLLFSPSPFPPSSPPFTCTIFFSFSFIYISHLLLLPLLFSLPRFSPISPSYNNYFLLTPLCVLLPSLSSSFFPSSYILLPQYFYHPLYLISPFSSSF